MIFFSPTHLGLQISLSHGLSSLSLSLTSLISLTHGLSLPRLTAASLSPVTRPDSRGGGRQPEVRSSFVWRDQAVVGGPVVARKVAGGLTLSLPGALGHSPSPHGLLSLGSRFLFIVAVKDRDGPARTASETDKRARRVTFEGSSRDSGGNDGGGRYDGTDEAATVEAGMAAGDGEGSVGGARTVEDGGGGDGGGEDGLGTVEGGTARTVEPGEKAVNETGTVEAGRWRRGRWTQGRSR
ncbi:hypothetical protein Syun_023888 [Stephania yunnanensis]|uniref:Uncharacterized protein n=1 Tax=Stephania yunnanensis TaxID=152371 RepID=A0AAP0I2J8_9MAGN